MAAKTFGATPKAYVLKHPDSRVTAVAEYRGIWVMVGRNAGLLLRFQGESFDRRLTYAEIGELQKPEGAERV